MGELIEVLARSIAAPGNEPGQPRFREGQASAGGIVSVGIASQRSGEGQRFRLGAGNRCLGWALARSEGMENG